MGLLRYNSPDPVCTGLSGVHRTVRWASGATANWRQWSTAKWTVHVNNDEQCVSESERRSQRVPDMSGAAPDCPVQLQDNSSNGRPAPNPNGRVDVARTGQWIVIVRCSTGLSGVPIASRLSQRLWKWLGAINTPNHLIQSYHTRFWKATRMRTMYVSGSAIHVHSNYITGHHHTVLK
jgi:hypothetical protein